MDYKEFARSKKFRNALFILGGIVIALLIFQAGMFLGYRQAAFSYRWGDNYYRAFDERTEPPGGLPRGTFSETNGAVGIIVKVDLPTIIIADNGGIEKSVVLTDDTAIRQFRQTVQATDLHEGDFVTVLGSPNSQSQIVATLIRLVPPPPPSGAQNGTSTLP